MGFQIWLNNIKTIKTQNLILVSIMTSWGATAMLLLCASPISWLDQNCLPGGTDTFLQRPSPFQTCHLSFFFFFCYSHTHNPAPHLPSKVCPPHPTVQTFHPSRPILSDHQLNLVSAVALQVRLQSRPIEPSAPVAGTAVLPHCISMLTQLSNTLTGQEPRLGGGAWSHWQPQDPGRQWKERMDAGRSRMLSQVLGACQ